MDRTHIVKIVSKDSSQRQRIRSSSQRPGLSKRNWISEISLHPNPILLSQRGTSSHIRDFLMSDNLIFLYAMFRSSFEDWAKARKRRIAGFIILLDVVITVDYLLKKTGWTEKSIRERILNSFNRSDRSDWLYRVRQWMKSASNSVDSVWGEGFLPWGSLNLYLIQVSSGSGRKASTAYFHKGKAIF